jgi:hypothetical protein
MRDPQKHHYLPVFYLKQWAGLDGRLIRFHRPHHEIVAHPIAPKNAGYEPGLYSLEGYGDDRRDVIEKQFLAPNVDDPAAAALSRLLERGSASNLTLAMRQAWTRFLMSLHVRHPDGIAQISTQGSRALRNTLTQNPAEYESLRTPDDPSTLVEWVEQNAPALFDNYGKSMLPGIVTHQATGTEILRMKWFVVRGTGSEIF